MEQENKKITSLNPGHFLVYKSSVYLDFPEIQLKVKFTGDCRHYSFYTVKVMFTGAGKSYCDVRSLMCPHNKFEVHFYGYFREK